MKTIMFALAITALFGTGLPPINAQDAPTRPLQSTPPPGEQISPTPAATQTPSAEESEAKTDQNADTGSATEKEKATKPTSVPSPAKAIANSEKKPRARKKPVAATASSDEISGSSNIAAQLKAMEKEWEASFNDPVVIEKSVSDDFVGTSPDGRVVSKKSLLRDAKNSSGPAPTTIAHDLDVHFYGPGVAVVVGAAKQTDKNSAGQTVRHDYRFTDTWVLRDGKWRCVASQAILLPKR